MPTADRSAASAALGAGSYSYKASVADNANYLGDSSDCENFTVNKAQPSILTTQDPASGSVGDTYNDTATLSDGVMLDGTGSITFTLYDAAGCDGKVIDTETVDNISANGDYSTPTGVKLDSAGTYYWVASFSGDSNNLSADSGCDDEPVVVKPAAIHIVKTPDAAQVNAGEQIGFTLTVYNDGSGDAHGVTLSDTLPVKAGLSWSIASQGAGWNWHLRDRGGRPDLRPGDGAGGDDAGRVDVHGAHHLADDGRDGWCLSGGQRCDRQHRRCDDHERRLGRLDRFDLCGGAGDPHREDGGRGPGERRRSDRLHPDRVQHGLG